jgi:DNA-binding FadR family transcriptional regulator
MAVMEREAPKEATPATANRQSRQQSAQIEAALLFERMSNENGKVSRLAADIVCFIENELYLKGWPVDVVITSEVDLATSFSISRDVVREAVRIGEGHGSLRTRRGRNGGIVSQRPDPGSVSRTISEYMYCAGATQAEFREFCMVFAPMAAVAAAKSRSDKVNNASPSDSFSYSPFTGDFEISILAHLSDPVLALLWRIMGDLDVWLAGRTIACTDEDRMQSRALKSRIAEAIAAGNTAAASSLTIDLLNEYWRKQSLGPAECGPENYHSPMSGELPALASKALSSQVAQRICDRIRSTPRGEKLGSEWDLSVEYEVTRPIVRQALRLLEDHGLLYIKRGRSGGIFVSEQKPGAMLRYTYPYLASCEVRINHLPKFFWPINLAHVRLASAKMKHLSALERNNIQRNLAKVVADGDECLNWFDVQQLIAQLGESVIFDTLARILVGYILRSQSINGAIPDLSSKQLTQKSLRVVDAITANEVDEAIALQMECHEMLEAKYAEHFNSNGTALRACHP